MFLVLPAPPVGIMTPQLRGKDKCTNFSGHAGQCPILLYTPGFNDTFNKYTRCKIWQRMSWLTFTPPFLLLGQGEKEATKMARSKATRCCHCKPRDGFSTAY